MGDRMNVVTMLTAWWNKELFINRRTVVARKEELRNS
jgi:hypothetical protein